VGEFMSLDKIIVIVLVLISLAALVGINLKARRKELMKEELQASKKPSSGEM
jgi:hypothetical protein